MSNLIEWLEKAALIQWQQCNGNYEIETFMEHEAAQRIKELTEALESIAANTCCDGCQEAALVARKALQEPPK